MGRVSIYIPTWIYLTGFRNNFRLVCIYALRLLPFFLTLVFLLFPRKEQSNDFSPQPINVLCFTQ
jgi:hypothetical protein